MFTRVIALFLIAVYGVFGLAASGPASAREFIRDTEIEAILTAYATPIYRAAGLDPNSVQMYIISDPALNAFVAGGQRMFINTGTLEKASTPEEVIGVIAHEAGHIAGAHLSRTQDVLRNARAVDILATIAGIAAGVATGRGDVGGAAVLGGRGAATSGFLAYSRAQESSADAAGYKFLDRAGISAEGMRTFLGLLEDQELVSPARQDAYLRTHPFARERIDQLEAHLARSPHTGTPLAPEFYEYHRRMQAKIYAYTNSRGRVMRRYPPEDESPSARYARAIAHFRHPDVPAAQAELAPLLADEPGNPYFYELKGRMLFDIGDVDGALPALTKAVELAPNAPLIRIVLGHAQIESGDPDLLSEAQANLIAALGRERRNASAWRFLAVAYGRDGLRAEASYAQSEYSLLRGERQAALFHACQAIRELPSGAPLALRAQDIVNSLDRGLERKISCN